MIVDKKKYLHDFHEEAGEYLSKLNENLLLLSKEPEHQDYLSHLKREAHNLKGSARMLELVEIGTITHSIEFIFEALTDKRLTISPLLMDSLFNSFDLLQLLVEKGVRQEKIDLDIANISANLEKLGRNEPGMEFFPDELKGLIESVKRTLSNREHKQCQDIEPENKEGTLRVKSGKVEELLGLVGEVIVDKIKNEELLNGLRLLLMPMREHVKMSKIFAKELGSDFETKSGITFQNLLEQIERIEKKLRGFYKEDVSTINHLSLIINKLQENVFRLRMLPISVIFETFPRAVYDLAQHFNKKITIEMRGKETEFDKKIVEMMKEPLIHILRNAIDHGIESEERRQELGKPTEGSLIISAWQEGDYVFISFEDDGTGIDPKMVKDVAIAKKVITQEEADELSERELMYLVFRQGLSTSTTVTELSGRGVGLDIVREKVEDLKGEINLDSTVGKGTKITIKLPLTLSSTSVLLVKCNERTFAVPTANIEEIVRINKDEIKYVDGGPVATLKRRIIPLAYLKDILNLPADEKKKEEKEKYLVMVIAYGRQRKGFIVDTLLSEQKVVIKSLGEFIRKIRYIAGATILGNGDVVLLLHIPDLMRMTVARAARATQPEEVQTEDIGAEVVRKKVLLVEDSLITREMERSILASAGYEVFEAANGVEALEIITLNKIHLVITDLQMPEMDGWQFIGELKKKEEFKNIPIIVVSSLEKIEDKKRGLELGINAYIVKSDFDQRKLIEMVETFTG